MRGRSSVHFRRAVELETRSGKMERRSVPGPFDQVERNVLRRDRPSSRWNSPEFALGAVVAVYRLFRPAVDKFARKGQQESQGRRCGFAAQRIRRRHRREICRASDRGRGENTIDGESRLAAYDHDIAVLVPVHLPPRRRVSNNDRPRKATHSAGGTSFENRRISDLNSASRPQWRNPPINRESAS